MATKTLTVETDLFGELRFEVTYTHSPFRPGKYSGPPEHCYPDEPEELEIESIFVINSPAIPSTIDVRGILSPDFLEEVEDQLYDAIHDDTPIDADYLTGAY